MVKHDKYVILLILAAVLVGIAAMLYLFTSESSQVKKRFSSVATWMSKEGEESNLVTARKIQNMMSILAETCVIQDPMTGEPQELSGREIAQRAVLARRDFTTITLKFPDLDIAFPDKNTATAIATARATGVSKEGDLFSATYELECTLQKGEEGWVFSAVEIVEVLEK
jgi:hypothetical protein